MKIYIVSIARDCPDEEPLILRAFKSLNKAKLEVRKRKKESSGDYIITPCELEDYDYFLTN